MLCKSSAYYIDNIYRLEHSFSFMQKKLAPQFIFFLKLAHVVKLKSHLNIHTKVPRVHLQTLLENPVCLYGSQAEHYHLHNSEPTEN